MSQRVPSLEWAEEIRRECLQKLQGIETEPVIHRVRKCRIEWSMKMGTSAGRAHSGRDWMGVKPRIKLSAKLYSIPENFHDFPDTVIHEIAHIAAGTWNHHNHVWRSVCKLLGGSGQRCHKLDTTLTTRTLRIMCKCGVRYRISRRSREFLQYGRSITGRCGCTFTQLDIEAAEHRKRKQISAARMQLLESGLLPINHGRHPTKSSAEAASSGNVITRNYKGRVIQVTVLSSGFEFEGHHYDSLTAVAKEITGYKSISGPAFFGRA